MTILLLPLATILFIAGYLFTLPAYLVYGSKTLVLISALVQPFVTALLLTVLLLMFAVIGTELPSSSIPGQFRQGLAIFGTAAVLFASPVSFLIALGGIATKKEDKDASTSAAEDSGSLVSKVTISVCGCAFLGAFPLALLSLFS